MAQEIKRKHFILVHGLCHGAWCWYKISTLLQKAGHCVTAVDLAACGTHPSRLDELHSFTDYTEPLTRTMVSIPPGEKVIIVGHSFGGLSVSLAMEKFSEKISVAVFAAAVMTCVENPKLFISEVFSQSREIYMDCKMKEKQETANQLSSIEFGPEYMSNKLYQNCPIEALPVPVYIFIKPIRRVTRQGKMPKNVQKDLELAKLLVRPGTQFKDDKIYEKMITKEKYGQVPRVYIVCRDDRIAPEQFQKWMIEQSPGTEVMEIAGADHMLMLSKPTELFHVLQEIANKYS